MHTKWSPTTLFPLRRNLDTVVVVRKRRRVGWAVLLALVVASAPFLYTYRRQLVSGVSHRGGSPTSTWPFPTFAPGNQPIVRLAAAGDVGYAGTRAARTGRAMARTADGDPYDALVLLGDNVYPAGDPERLEETVFGPFKSVLEAGSRVLPIVGNHDVAGGRADEQLARLGRGSRWYAEHIGPVLFVALDSTRPAEPVQLQWLAETLASTTARWRIVALHHPPFSAGYQGSSLDARRSFAPLFERFGVQLVLSGHDHDFQRSRPINGVTYVVSGGASDARRTGREDFTAFSASWHHFVDIAVFDEYVVLRAVNQDSRVFDELRLPG